MIQCIKGILLTNIYCCDIFVREQVAQAVSDLQTRQAWGCNVPHFGLRLEIQGDCIFLSGDHWPLF